MHNAIKGDKNLELKARWEQKTDSVITRNIVRDRISDMKKRAAADLKSRKAKLAQLLASEDQQYEKEFMENLETPEQVRAKMAERLSELQSQRESERKELVQHARAIIVLVVLEAADFDIQRQPVTNARRHCHADACV